MRIPHSKLFATAAALAAVSIVAIGGTYASFTTTPTTISSNAFASGSLSMSRSGSGAVFSLAAAKVGDTATGNVTINNTGTLAAVYTLSGSTTGSAVLAGQLDVKIYSDNDNVVGSKIYDGTLAAFTSVGLGTFAGTSGSHTYYFHVSLPTTGTDAGDNAFQGLSTSAAFTWSATQA
jgi:spore coat-associated protein N